MLGINVDMYVYFTYNYLYIQSFTVCYFFTGCIEIIFEKVSMKFYLWKKKNASKKSAKEFCMDGEIAAKP